MVTAMYPTIQNRKIRIAIVGCGRISKNHFGSIEKHADSMELAAVCDAHPATLQDHVQRYKAPGYASMDEMLQKEPIDLVAICTPSGIHSDPVSYTHLDVYKRQCLPSQSSSPPSSS